MELGIFAKTFRRPDARATLEAVRALGLGCVQFNFECAGLPSMPDEVPSSTLTAIAAASRATGVRLAALSGTFNMAHPERDVRKKGLLQLRIVMEAAARLSVPLVTLCTGSRDLDNMWRAHADNRSAGAWTDLLETLEGALSLAVPSGVILAVEPEQANVVDTARRARALLDTLGAGERLQVILDPANLLEQGRAQRDVLREAIDLLGADLAIAHAKDRGTDGAVCALGRGAVDFKDYFGLLRSAGFPGPVIMHGFEETQAAESTAFARAQLEGTPAGSENALR